MSSRQALCSTDELLNIGEGALGEENFEPGSTGSFGTRLLWFFGRVQSSNGDAFESHIANVIKVIVLVLRCALVQLKVG